MACGSPYGTPVVHQAKSSGAGDAGSVNSTATRSTPNHSRSSSTDSDASTAVSNTWSDKATVSTDNVKSRANTRTGVIVTVSQ